jgi:hypothetical protein
MNEELIKSLPEEAQQIWMESVNKSSQKLGLAIAQAWADVRKAGYNKKDGIWTKVEKDSPASGPTASSVHVNRPLGEKEDKDNSVGNVSMGCNVKKEYVFKIAKADEEKRLAFGWSVISRTAKGDEVWDLQDDAIDPDELEALAYKYVKLYRDSGELHNGSNGKAVLIESVVTTLEKQQVWGIPSGVMPVGWWTGFYVLDDDVWEKVKNGQYAAFSIEGSAIREKV